MNKTLSIYIRLIVKYELDLQRHDDGVNALTETWGVLSLNAHNLGAVKNTDVALRGYSASVFVLLYWVFQYTY